LRDSGPSSCDRLDKKDSGGKAITRRREEVGDRETMFFNLQRGHLAIEVMIPTNITGESVKFFGIIIQESFIAYIPEYRTDSYFIRVVHFTSFITISQHLKFKLKIQTTLVLINKLKLLQKALDREANLTFLSFTPKH